MINQRASSSQLSERQNLFSPALKIVQTGLIQDLFCSNLACQDFISLDAKLPLNARYSADLGKEGDSALSRVVSMAPAVEKGRLAIFKCSQRTMLTSLRPDVQILFRVAA
ncbi:hypothetical protein PoB_003817400 [Plakobranchus ocellatus]|uniref:Uncharacterized protein n=1 Tax=Plakobranchus ocellatus TaxID=259542 RepID=A0AAV4AZZ1_9GAST|nr:hypothetical protein PoB_003817400 [Plakobranchus ocellatus]